MTYQLGVDLGTTFTAAAVSNGMPPTMVGLGNRALQIPSVAFLAEDGNLLVGEAAERRGLAQPDRVVREFKRRIGDPVPILIAGTPFSPQALTARLLQHVVQTATQRMGEAPGRIILTHPANWGPYKLELLNQIARMADAGDAARCPEPIAAAAQYAAKSTVVVGDVIAVYDLGGGTFDSCVLEKTPTGFEVLGTPEGIEHLGGVDFDDALFQYVCGLLADKLSTIDPDGPEAVVGLSRLRRDCVEAKEALSADTETMLPVNLPGHTGTLRLTRTEFENLIRPALGDSVDSLARAVRSADRCSDQLHAIVLVGGSSRIPLIAELLQRSFAATPTAMDTHPKHDIALGSVHTERTSYSQPLGQSRSLSRPNQPAADARSAPTEAAGADDALTAPAAVPSGRITRVGPSEPRTSAPPSLNRPSTSHDGEESAVRGRRWVIVAAGTAVAITLGWAGYAALDVGGDTAGPPAPTLGPHTAPPSADNRGPAPLPGNLPASSPLPATQLVVPMRSDRGDWNLYLADTTKPGPIKQLTTADTSDNLPVLSPRRDTIIYVVGAGDSSTQRTLRVMAADGTGDRPLFDLPRGCDRAIRPGWSSADPSQLAVPCVSAAGKYSLRIIRTDGTVLRTVTPPKGTTRMDDPAFSHDGKLLGFWAAPDNGWDGGTLFTVPTSGGDPQRLLPRAKDAPEGQDADLAFSPDGKYVAFRRRMETDKRDGQLDIFRADLNGSNLKRLTDGAANEQDPTWSPDSHQIAIKSDADSTDWLGRRNTRVWVIARDGGQRQQVLWTSPDTDRAQSVPSWTSR